MPASSPGISDRELDAGTGLALMVIGCTMAVVCLVVDRSIWSLPGVLGLAFLTIGSLILAWSRSPRRPKSSASSNE